MIPNQTSQHSQNETAFIQGTYSDILTYYSKKSSIFVSFLYKKFDISQNNVIFQLELNCSNSDKKMKKTLKVTVVAVFTAFLSSCGYLAQKTDPKGYSQAITTNGVKPLHIGHPVPHKDGVYHVQTYHRSVVFQATTGLVRPSQVEVFDLDHNGTFDVVYLQQSGVWSIGFTRHFSSKNKVIADSLSKKDTLEWIKRANQSKRSTNASNTSKKKRVQAQPSTLTQKRPDTSNSKQRTKKSTPTTNTIPKNAPKAEWWSPQ